ncbi:hypothetical protein CEXT_32201, partial [Caerostris extrusa]
MHSGKERCLYVTKKKAARSRCFGGWNKDGECCFIGSVLEYGCDEEYELVGESMIECLPGSNWSSPRPFVNTRADAIFEAPTLMSTIEDLNRALADYRRTMEVNGWIPDDCPMTAPDTGEAPEASTSQLTAGPPTEKEGDYYRPEEGVEIHLRSLDTDTVEILNMSRVRKMEPGKEDFGECT